MPQTESSFIIIHKSWILIFYLPCVLRFYTRMVVYRGGITSTFVDPHSMTFSKHLDYMKTPTRSIERLFPCSTSFLASSLTIYSDKCCVSKEVFITISSLSLLVSHSLVNLRTLTAVPMQICVRYYSTAPCPYSAYNFACYKSRDEHKPCKVSQAARNGFLIDTYN
jgi:hypothetical protein